MQDRNVRRVNNSARRRSGKLKQVGIRIPEVKTGTPSLPLNFRFNFDSTLAQSRPPSSRAHPRKWQRRGGQNRVSHAEG